MLIRSSSLVTVVFTLGLLAAPIRGGEMRTWVDSSGKHRIEAEFVKVVGDDVTLRNASGKEVTLPVARLSQDDQAFVRQQLAASGGSGGNGNGSGKSSPPRGKLAAAKPVAKRFYTARIDENYDELKSLLTPEAQANWDAAKAALESMEVPDNRQAVLVRAAKADGEMADVNVSIKVKGKFHKHRLQMRWSGDQWLVATLITDEEDAKTVNFEPGAGEERTATVGARRSSRNAAEGEDGDDAAEQETGDDEASASDEEESSEEDEQARLFRVPDGGPDELLAYVEQLKQTKPPQGGTRDEQMQFQLKLFTAMLEATSKVLEAEASQAQLTTAAETKLQVLALLSRVSRDPAVAKSLEEFPGQLTQLGLNELASRARSVALGLALASARSVDDAKQVILQVRDHLQGLDKLEREDLVLVQTVGSLAERIDAKLAVTVYRELATLLEKNPATKSLAEIMLGTARRLDLVGNPMELAGITANDQPFDLASLKGKVVLVDFWATWCGPCLREIPNIRKNYDKYHERGFEVVAVSVDRDLDALKKFVEQETPPWLILVDEHPQNERKMGRYYGVNAIPTTILVGPDGKVITMNCRGERLGAELEKALGSESS